MRTPGPSRRARFDLDAGDAGMALTVLIWAGNNVLTKAYVERIGAVPYVFGRFVIVCLLLFAYLIIRGSALSIARADWRWFVLTGVTGFAAYNLLFTLGLEHTSAFSVAILVALGPVFALVFTVALGIERIRRTQWLGVVCAMAGVPLFVGEKLSGAVPVTGDLLSILAAASFAGYSLATRPIVRRYGSQVVTAWSALIGLVVSLPITLPAALEMAWGGLDYDAWLALFYSSALSMLLAYTIWGWAIERKGVGRTVPYLYLVPVLTGGMAMLLLDEDVGLAQLAGAALVIGGVGLARRMPALPAAEPPSERGEGCESLDSRPGVAQAAGKRLPGSVR